MKYASRSGLTAASGTLLVALPTIAALVGARSRYDLFPFGDQVQMSLQALRGLETMQWWWGMHGALGSTHPGPLGLWLHAVGHVTSPGDPSGVMESTHVAFAVFAALVVAFSAFCLASALRSSLAGVVYGAGLWVSALAVIVLQSENSPGQAHPAVAVVLSARVEHLTVLGVILLLAAAVAWQTRSAVWPLGMTLAGGVLAHTHLSTLPMGAVCLLLALLAIAPERSKRPRWRLYSWNVARPLRVATAVLWLLFTIPLIGHAVVEAPWFLELARSIGSFSPSASQSTIVLEPVWASDATQSFLAARGIASTSAFILAALFCLVVSSLTALRWRRVGLVLVLVWGYACSLLLVLPAANGNQLVWIPQTLIASAFLATAFAASLVRGVWRPTLVAACVSFLTAVSMTLSSHPALRPSSDLGPRWSHDDQPALFLSGPRSATAAIGAYLDKRGLSRAAVLAEGPLAGQAAEVLAWELAAAGGQFCMMQSRATGLFLAPHRICPTPLDNSWVILALADTEKPLPGGWEEVVSVTAAQERSSSDLPYRVLAYVGDANTEVLPPNPDALTVVPRGLLGGD